MVVSNDEAADIIRDLLRGQGTITIKLRHGQEITVPKSALRRAVLENPDQDVLTTQQAARLLNVSRPFIVKLTETGEIPSTTTGGGHRRILRKDVEAYRDRMDQVRRRALDELLEISQDAGAYESEPEEKR